jgi:CheY-like chemotaxis protein
MSPLKRSTNIAARMGRWSAHHRKTAIFGWPAFVIASFAIGTTVGMKTIDQNDTNVGEARTADHIIRDAGFKLDEQMEYVLVQSQTATVKDPAFRAVVDQAVGKLQAFPKLTKLRSPLAAGNEGQVSADGHSVLIQFSPKGSYDEATGYIDTITAATATVQKANPDYTVVEAGTGRAAIQEMAGASRPFGVIVLDLRLPDSDSLALLTRLHSLAPGAQIILMTAHGTGEVADEARALGAYGFVSKPFEMSAMASLVTEASRASIA